MCAIAKKLVQTMKSCHLKTEKGIKFNHIGTQKESFSCIFVPSFISQKNQFLQKHILGRADIFRSVVGEVTFK